MTIDTIFSSFTIAQDMCVFVSNLNHDITKKRLLNCYHSGSFEELKMLRFISCEEVPSWVDDALIYCEIVKFYYRKDCSNA